MKKALSLVILLGGFFVHSCQQKPAEQQAEQKSAEQLQTQQTLQLKDMQAFARQKGCFACHDINTKKVGPAFKDVAKKMANEKDAEAHLAERIKKGGVGEWGNVPMPPQNVTDQEAKELAKWVLSLK